MKKSLIALLSVMVVMLFTVSAFALHAVPEMYEYTPSIVKSKKAMIEIGGSIRVRGELRDNNDNFNDNGGTAAIPGTDLNGDGDFDDVETPDLVYFDHDNDPSTAPILPTLQDLNGDGDFDDAEVAPTAATEDPDNTKSAYDQRVRVHLKATVSPNTFGFVEFEGNASQSSDSYGWANCDAASGIYGKGNCKPTGVTTRQAFISHQGKDLGILSGFKVGHMLLALGNGMFFNHTQYGDDAIVGWISPMDGMELSAIVIKFDENNSASSDDVDAYVGTFAGSFGPASISADVTAINDNEYGVKGLDFWNLGLRAAINAGPAKIKVDGEFQTGSAEDNGTTKAGAVTDQDYSGYAFLVGADIAAGPVTIGVEAAYGSGDDIDTADEYEGFVTSQSAGQRFTYLYDQKACTAASSTCMKNTGLNNTMYFGVGVSAKAGPDVKLSGDVYYLQAAEKVSNTAGFDEKDIGIEVDGKVQYQIDTNLVYYVEAGYLFAGDFYANMSGDVNNIDDPYSVRNGIILKF